jgi:hypothetical protein
MRRLRLYGICLLTLLWLGFPTPPMSGQLLTEAEIDSMIPLDVSYAGSEVRALVKGLVASARAEIRTAAAEAVKAAVIPLEADLAGERVRSARWEAAYRAELAGRVWGKVLLFTSAGLMLFAGGAALGAAVF